MMALVVRCKCSQNREHRPERFGVSEIVAICGSGDNWYDHIPKAFSRHWPQRPSDCLHDIHGAPLRVRKQHAIDIRNVDPFGQATGIC